MSDCEHNYEYQGTVYRPSTYTVPGSGAYARMYSDRYYCTKCLDTKDKNERECGNTYGKPLEGTLPA